MYSPFKQVKYEANIAYTVLRSEQRKITQSWLDIIKKDSLLEPKEIAIKIANNQGLKPTTVAGYAKLSSNKNIRSQAMKAYHELRKADKRILHSKR